MTHIFKKILKLVFPQNILYFNLLCGYAEVGHSLIALQQSHYMTTSYYIICFPKDGHLNCFQALQKHFCECGLKNVRLQDMLIFNITRYSLILFEVVESIYTSTSCIRYSLPPITLLTQDITTLMGEEWLAHN